MKRKLLFVGLSCAMLLTGCNAFSQDNKGSSTETSATKEDSMKDNMDGEKMSDKKMSDSDKMKDEKMSDEKMSDSDKMKDEKMSDKKMNKGKLASDFELKGIDGKTYKLSDYRGKKVYVKFWASWCSICLSTLPDADELAKEQGDDYVVLSVVTPKHNGEKSTADFKKWFSGLDYKNIPVLLDEDGKVSETYGLAGHPYQVFIGSDGVLVKSHTGFMSKEDIKKTLESIK